MANTRISDLTASASNLASTDLAPVVQTAGVGPVKMTGLQLAGGLLGSTTFNGSTVTTSSPVLNLTQTWNAGAVTFTGLKFNATDTASASGSLLLDLQVGGTTIFNVSKASNAYTNTKNGGFAYLAGNSSGGLLGRSNNNGANGLFLGSGTQFGFTDGSGDTGNIDVILRRATTATLQLGAADAAAPVAQTFKVQGVVAGTTNTAGANFTIQGSQGTGTGAGGSIIFQVAPAGSSGTAQNAYSTALTLNSAQQAVFAVGSASSTSLTWGAVNTGWYSRGNNWAHAVGGTQIMEISGGGTASVSIISPSALSFGLNPASFPPDVFLYRDAANTLALRNGTNAQIFRVYSTYNGTNDAYGAIGAAVNLDGTAGDANTLYIGSQKKGSPTALTKLAIQVNGSQVIDYNASVTDAWTISVPTKSICFDNGFVSIARDNTFGSGSLKLSSYADYNFVSSNSTPVFRLGGTTSSFPALKRSTTTLQVRLADDSAFSDVSVRGAIYNGVTFANLPGTPTTGTVAYVTDASNAGAAWGDSVTAGGSTNKYLVWYNGTNWTVVGK